MVYVDEAVETLNGIRGDERVDLFWTKVTSKAGAVDVGEPALPRGRKAPNRFDDICCAGVHKHRSPVDGEGVSPYYGMGANWMLSGS